MATYGSLRQFYNLSLNPKPCLLGLRSFFSKASNFWFLSHLVISVMIFFLKVLKMIQICVRI